MPRQRLDERHADAAATTLAETFSGDHRRQIVAPDEATRRRWAPWFMGPPLRYGLHGSEVWGTDDASAVVVWAPPDRGEMGQTEFDAPPLTGMSRRPRSPRHGS